MSELLHYAPAVGMALWAWLCRAAFYRSQRGRWVWGRLREVDDRGEVSS